MKTALTLLILGAILAAGVWMVVDADKPEQDPNDENDNHFIN